MKGATDVGSPNLGCGSLVHLILGALSLLGKRKMAEAVVSFALSKIGDLLIEKARLLHGVRGEGQDILTELRQIQSFLKDADARQDKHDTIRNLVVEIREVTYDAEDVIVTFIFKDETRKRQGIRSFLLRSACITNEVTARNKIGSEIKTLKAKITGLKSSLLSYGLIISRNDREGSSSGLLLRQTYSHVGEDNIIAFEQDIRMVIAELFSQETNNRRVVSICGMGGLGKTTLARKVYCDGDVRHHFDSFGWASISQQFHLKGILQRILSQLIPEKKMIDEQLIKLLYEVQQKRKCLVVLDDIWSLDHWLRLSPAFPSTETGSRVVLTTRNKDVAALVGQNSVVHELTCLNEEES